MIINVKCVELLLKDDTIDNLQVLCHKCNLAKTNRMDLKCTQEKLGESDDKSKA